MTLYVESCYLISNNFLLFEINKFIVTIGMPNCSWKVHDSIILGKPELL